MPASTVALASDANAGTFGAWGAMPLVIGLGATVLGMTVAGGSHRGHQRRRRGAGPLGRKGALAVGADADIVAWDAEHEGAFALQPR